MLREKAVWQRETRNNCYCSGIDHVMIFHADFDLEKFFNPHGTRACYNVGFADLVYNRFLIEILREWQRLIWSARRGWLSHYFLKTGMIP